MRIMAQTWVMHLLPFWVRSDASPPLPLASRLYSAAPFSHANTAAFGKASESGVLAVVAAGQLPVVDPRLAGRKKGKVMCAFYDSAAPESLYRLKCGNLCEM